MFYWRGPDGAFRRSWRTTYDEATQTFETSLAAGPELVKVKKSDVLRVNWEGRRRWNMTEVPCSTDGFGADVKLYDLVLELRRERDANEPKPPAYIEWRDKMLEQYESHLTEICVALRKAYPNTPVPDP